MRTEIHGIKCDNKDCDYSDMTVKREQYKSLIDAPCPKCGQSLMTQEDYNAVVLMEKMAESKVIKAVEFVMKLFRRKKKSVLVELDGKGKPKIKK